MGKEFTIQYKGVNDNLIIHKCLSLIGEELKKRLRNTFKFSDNDRNKLILLLRRGGYPYKYTDEWEKFN